MVMGCATIDAAQLTPAQLRAKKEIYSALKKYASNIVDSGEESMSFKYNGTTFVTSVNTLNSQALYLCLVLMFTLPENYNSEMANIAACNAALGKPVCSVATAGALVFSCEMYAKEAKPFIDVLPEMIAALEDSANKFQEEYNKVVDTYTSSGTSKAPSVRLNEHEFIYPYVVSSSKDDAGLFVTKVTLTPQYTVLDMVSYNNRHYQWCSISRSSYLSANGRRYSLISAEGIAYSPKYTYYPNWQSGKDVALSFRLFFPPLPKGTTNFDFRESPVDGGGWRIKGIELKHGNTYAIDGECLETAYHKWKCVAMEVQDNKTIVIKTVQPQDNGTYMYSSQNEYIEDADTGRKYYLKHSSIGFEGSPTISHDTQAITFYEVYPALPASVRKINISSGTQYYAKGIIIR